MGIDLADVKCNKSTHRKVIKSPNPYLKLLADLYAYLARRTDSGFNRQVAKRIIQANRFRPVVSLQKVVRMMKGREDMIACVVGSVSNDLRIHDIPKLTVCALKVTENARERIISAGGEVLTFDQLALRAPRGERTVLIKGPVKSREAERHFGRAPGVPGSNAKPYVRSKGRKFEKARGRRRSRAYKV